MLMGCGVVGGCLCCKDMGDEDFLMGLERKLVRRG